MCSESGTRSWISVPGKAPLGQMARSLTSERPLIISVLRAMGISGFSNLPWGPRWPTRNSETWLEPPDVDRKSTRLNSSHEWSSYAVFRLKKQTLLAFFPDTSEPLYDPLAQAPARPGGRDLLPYIPT